jgi:hypothetical protein
MESQLALLRHQVAGETAKREVAVHHSETGYRALEAKLEAAEREAADDRKRSGRAFADLERQVVEAQGAVGEAR